jgi:DMSO reductase anchor subunit
MRGWSTNGEQSYTVAMTRIVLVAAVSFASAMLHDGHPLRAAFNSTISAVSAAMVVCKPAIVLFVLVRCLVAEHMLWYRRRCLTKIITIVFGYPNGFLRLSRGGTCRPCT